MKILQYILAAVFVSSVAGAAEMGLNEFLTKAWKQNPLASVSHLREQESEEWMKSGEGRYFPHLSLEALDSTGFPGSTSSLHIGGLMGSPFRKGFGGGVVLDQLIYDFGRTKAVLQRYKADEQLVGAQLAQEKLSFVARVGAVYLQCARAKLLVKTDEELVHLETLIAKETDKMTKTGQKTVVDRSLSQMDLDELKLQESDLKAQIQAALAEMRIYLPEARSAEGECATLNPDFTAGAFTDFQVQAPSLLLAKAQVQEAEASLQAARSSQRPTLNLVGSYGYLQDVRLVPIEDYSLGVGFSFPFFNGGEDAHRESASRLAAEAQTQEYRRLELEFKAHLKSLDDRLVQLKEDLKTLEEHQKLSNKTMKLAVHRYLNLQGTLVDVREAFKRIRSVEEEQVRALSEWVSLELERKILLVE